MLKSRGFSSVFAAFILKLIEQIYGENLQNQWGRNSYDLKGNIDLMEINVSN